MENCTETDIIKESLPVNPGVEPAELQCNGADPEENNLPEDTGIPADAGEAGDTENPGTASEAEDETDAGDSVVESGGMTQADIERLIAEAEARGYERGRTAGIEAWINEGRPEGIVPKGGTTDNEGEIMILNNMRRSVWE